MITIDGKPADEVLKIETSKSTSLIKVMPALFLLMFYLKATGAVSWPWWVVWAPIWGPIVFAFVAAIIAIIVLYKTGVLEIKDDE